MAQINLQLKTKSGTISNIPKGVYNVTMEGYKYGYYFTQSYDSVFHKNDTNLIWVNEASCNPLDTGIASSILTNVHGCDSTVMTITTLLPKSQVTVKKGSCNVQDTATVVVKHSAANGCDSIVTTITTLLLPSYTKIDLNTCSALDSGTVINNLTATNGCDSIVTTRKAYVGLKATVVAETNQLTAFPAGQKYLWLDCSDNYKEISGETDQKFNIVADGVYAAKVSNEYCLDTTECKKHDTCGTSGEQFPS